MIKAEQIPDEVERAFFSAALQSDLSHKEMLAAALNAWPFRDVCHYTIKNTEGSFIILPLPQEGE